MNIIKHLFFDLDYTLWDFDKNSKNAYAKLFKKHKIKVNLDLFLSKYKPINLAYWQKFRNNEIKKEALKIGRLKDSFNALNFEIDQQIFPVLAQDYLRFLAQEKELFEGAIETLDYLRTKYQLHIITNGFEATQLEKIKNAGLDNYFDVIVTSNSVGVKKPNPLIYFYALKKAKAQTYQSMMIGDSLEADIYGAKNVGIQSIYFNPLNREKGKFLSIQHLTELKELL